jgi:hypothetical protein
VKRYPFTRDICDDCISGFKIPVGSMVRPPVGFSIAIIVRRHGHSRIGRASLHCWFNRPGEWMRFFRASRGFGGLALFALAMQFALAFGHHHDHPIVQSIQATLSAPASSTELPGPVRGGDSQHSCRICWLISVAGALVLPTPIAIHLPVSVPTLVVRGANHAVLTDSKTVKFQARAPPVVAVV